MPQADHPVSAHHSGPPVGSTTARGSEVRYHRVEATGPAPGREVEDTTTWRRLLHAAEPLHNLRLQGLDLTQDKELLLARDELTDIVVLGGVLDHEVEEHLRSHGAIVFPAAVLGHRLAKAGFLVATGGGPGAMEAANLGAWAPDEVLRPRATQRLRPADRQVLLQRPARTCCLPNSRDGLVVLPGAAGTVQEVFQMATRLYYEVGAVEAVGQPAPLPSIVLVGHEHWAERLPVWPLLQALGQGRRMAGALHLVDAVDEAAALLGCSPT